MIIGNVIALVLFLVLVSLMIVVVVKDKKKESRKRKNVINCANEEPSQVNYTIDFASNECTRPYQDPFTTGSEVDCCYSTLKCLKEEFDWGFQCVPCSKAAECLNSLELMEMQNDIRKCPPSLYFPPSKCAAAYEDPFEAEDGFEIDCCYSTVKCLSPEWDWGYRCVPCSQSSQCENSFELSELITDITKCPNSSPELVLERKAPATKRGIALKEISSEILTSLENTTS